VAGRVQVAAGEKLESPNPSIPRFSNLLISQSAPSRASRDNTRPLPIADCLLGLGGPRLGGHFVPDVDEGVDGAGCEAGEVVVEVDEDFLLLRQ
jgi:hypothetical protein